MAILEACVETADEARAAEIGGAARVELCADLDHGGTTPAESVIAACVAAVGIPVFVMIRPRAGPFVYSSVELATMQQQIARARALGARGIVTGSLTAAETLAADVMSALVEAAGPLPVTCHRAFDAARNREAALEALVGAGVSRVLTSGGAATAENGAEEIARLVRLAAGRLVVMAGGRVRAPNARAIVVRTGVSEVHAHLTTADAVRDLVANLGVNAPT